MIVSPDGSLRCKDSVISVEIKCPFSTYVGMTPVFYSVKPRHVVQCYLEADVLEASDHLYVSWSNESTTVFRMKPNSSVVKEVCDEVKKVFYGDYPSRPTKTSDIAKSLKQQIKSESDKAEFIGEFPSLLAKSSIRSAVSTSSETAFYSQEQNNDKDTSKCLNLKTVVQYLHKGIKQLIEAFRYQKPMASEVLVYLMSDMDRTWHREVGHGIPITYLFKGYSLTMGTARRILEEVLQECDKLGAHVPCVTFDGQFARLKDYDELENPLTLFALQRKFWTEIQKLSKREIIHKISDLFKDPQVLIVTDGHLSENNIVVMGKHCVIVQNKTSNCLPIQTSFAALKPKSKCTSDVDNENSNAIVTADTAGLDDDIVSVLEVVQRNNSSLDREKEDTVEDTVTSRPREDVAIDIQTDGNVIGLENQSASDRNDFENETIMPDESDYTIVLRMLQDTKRQKWKSTNLEQMIQIFQNAEKINKELTGYELNQVIKYLNLKLKKHGTSISQSLRKSEKINSICNYTGISTQVNVPPKRKRSKAVKSLKAMCIAELQKKTYPKQALAMSYACSYWLCYKDKWFETATVAKDICIKFTNDYGEVTDEITMAPIYTPEYSAKRNQLEVRVMDGTHIRTNIKSKIIRHGLGETVCLRAWKTVALSGQTDLAPAMLEVQHAGKIMHQQSDPFVRTMFAEDVEQAMVRNGDLEEAKFCRLFRLWHEAEDKPGLQARERCQRSLQLRNWLLENYSFGSFPPPTQYVRGIPRTTFEGLVCSIDAHILLYLIVKGGTYNWRSFSTLVAENFMGELAERSQNNHGVPSGNTLPTDMTKISELHAMRLNPNRLFQMKTSKSRAYEVPEGIMEHDKTFTVNIEHPKDRRLSEIIVRNHEFDRRKCVGKEKHGTISKLNEKPRGVQSVRHHYKVDESRILPSLRLGISEQTLEDLL